MFAQGGDDQAYGGSDVDYVEGNARDDRLYGGAGDEDLVGGSSSTLGKPTVDLRLSLAVSDRDITASGLLDGVDLIEGGADNDVCLGTTGGSPARRR